MRPILVTALATAVVSAAPGALASGLLVARFGGEWGHPTTDHLSAIYYNPAGLSLLGGTRLTLTGSFAVRAFTYERDPGGIDNILVDPAVGAGTPEGEGVAANSGEASLLNPVVTPFFAFGSDFGIEGFGAAIGLYVPIGGQTIFDKSEGSDAFPGALDGPARWWTIEGTARSIYGSAAIAYRFAHHRLSFGAALDVIYSEIDNVQARNADGTDHLVAGGRLQEGRVVFDVSGVDLGFGLGLLWEPVDHLFFGLSYRSQPGLGEQRLEGEATLALGGGPLGEDLTTPAEVRQELPDLVRVGLRYTEPKRWEVRLYGDWVNWSVLTKQCVLSRDFPNRTCASEPPIGKILAIPRDWHDGFEIRGGGSYWLSPDFELTFGAGFDSNAVPNRTLEPAFYDTDKLTLSVGMALDLVAGLRLETTLTYAHYFERDLAPRGRIPVDPNKPDGATKSDLGDMSESLRTPDGAGTYKQTIGVLEVGVTYDF